MDFGEGVTIECPKCAWKPGADSYWTCSCGYQWNTFDTAGRCPNCKKIWKDTQCHDSASGGCSQWSPHIDWYKGLTDKLRKELEEMQKAVVYHTS